MSHLRNCPWRCVCSMNLIDFMTSFDSFKIALKYIRPLIPNSRRRRLRCLRHLIKICPTVCRPSPQSHPGSSTSGTFLFHEKSFNGLRRSIRLLCLRKSCDVRLHLPYHTRNSLIITKSNFLIYINVLRLSYKTRGLDLFWN